MKRFKNSCYLGFTLIELILVIAIIAIGTGIALPSLVAIINEQKLTAQANNMIASLNFARSTSIKRRETITIRKVNSWESGWEIFVDVNDNGNQDANETLLKSYPALSQGSVVINSNNFVDYITYSPNGRANNLGYFTFCPPSNIDSSRKVIIAGSGRMHTERDTYAANCP